MLSPSGMIRYTFDEAGAATAAGAAAGTANDPVSRTEADRAAALRTRLNMGLLHETAVRGLAYALIGPLPHGWR
jgi:hypothetical protein